MTWIASRLTAALFRPRPAPRASRSRDRLRSSHDERVVVAAGVRGRLRRLRYRRPTPAGRWTACPGGRKRTGATVSRWPLFV